jgi:glycosyltransferase involved in cell wall biosynthesis
MVTKPSSSTDGAKATCNRKMKASIIIPTRNRPVKLSQAVNQLNAEMIHSSLSSTVEIIIVDDGSEKAIRNEFGSNAYELNSPAIKIVRTPEWKGTSWARNAGVGVCQGEILIFLDDDLIPGEHFIRETLAEHEKYPDTMVIVGNIKKLRNDFYSNYWFERYDALFNKKGSDFYEIRALSSGNFSIKRNLLNQINPLFDESLPSRVDYDLYLRLEEKGIAVFKSDRVLAYNDGGNWLWDIVRRRIWYTKGEYKLEIKYGKEFLKKKKAENPSIKLQENFPLKLLLYAVGAATYLSEVIKQRIGGRMCHCSNKAPPKN